MITIMLIFMLLILKGHLLVYFMHQQSTQTLNHWPVTFLNDYSTLTYPPHTFSFP